MPDPHQALAALIEPAPPPPETPASSQAATLAGAGVLLIAALLLAWRWRRNAPWRALKRLMRSLDADPATSARAGADALARLLPTLRVTPAQAWQRDLERLRFGPPAAADAATLARLCRELARR